MNKNSSLAALGEYAANVARSKDADEAFRYAEQVAGELIGHRLFTIMQFNPGTMEVRRCYSSDGKHYPTGGRKGKKDTQWGRHVLEHGRHFIGHDAADIRANFADYEMIESLGLGSVLNMPIRNLGQTIGTMNLLHKAGYYQSGHVDMATIIVSALAGVLVTMNLGD